MEAWLAEAVTGGPGAGGAAIVAQEQINDDHLQFVSFSWKRINLARPMSVILSSRSPRRLCAVR